MDKDFDLLCRITGKACGRFGLIEAGDSILLGVSGGKDSLMLAHVLKRLQEKAPFEFQVTLATFDPGFPGFDAEVTVEYCRSFGWNHHVEALPIDEIIRKKNSSQTPCVLCSRLRRGVLYTLGAKLNCNKLALGHHLDDIESSFLISLFRGQGLSTMPPKVKAKEHPITVIRPLALAEERLIIAAAAKFNLPMAGKCAYHTQLESGDRRYFRQILERLRDDIPDIKSNLLHSLGKVEVEFLLDPRFLE